ncbi:MAG TPA: PEP-CTERM sorting domain-containing protein [Fimbriimonas sp.]|nr:PEP-CTERM sorting domain-containing protein [Fimbriimonas sp.]
MNSLRLFATLGVFGAAISAQAFTISLISVGTFGPGVNYTSAENVVFQLTPAPLNTLSVAGTVVSPGPTQTLSALATYTGGSDSLTISYVTSPVIATPGNASYSGNWTYLSGTGAYAGLTGGGTMTVQFNSNLGNLSTHSITGDLDTVVPEPASMAALGLGAVALLRRRRSKSSR